MVKRIEVENLRNKLQLLEDQLTAKPNDGCNDALENASADELKRAMAKIARLVKVSDRSVKQIQDRLAIDGFSEAIIDAAIQRALDIGLLNDMHFADTLIRTRLYQGKGISGIERELKQNDIDPMSIPGWPHDYVEVDSEFNRAYELIRSHPPRSKNKREGAYRKLISKGYPSSIASSVARVWSEEQSNDSL